MLWRNMEVLKADWRETITIRRRRERDHLLHLSPFYTFYSNESTFNVLSSFTDHFHYQVIQEVFKSFIRDWYTMLQLPHNFNHRHICFGGKTNRCHRRFGVDTVAATTSTQYINGYRWVPRHFLIYLSSISHLICIAITPVIATFVMGEFCTSFSLTSWIDSLQTGRHLLSVWMLNKRCIEFFWPESLVQKREWDHHLFWLKNMNTWVEDEDGKLESEMRGGSSITNRHTVEVKDWILSFGWRQEGKWLQKIFTQRDARECYNFAIRLYVLLMHTILPWTNTQCESTSLLSHSFAASFWFCTFSTIQSIALRSSFSQLLKEHPLLIRFLRPKYRHQTSVLVVNAPFCEPHHSREDFFETFSWRRYCSMERKKTRFNYSRNSAFIVCVHCIRLVYASPFCLDKLQDIGNNFIFLVSAFSPVSWFNCLTNWSPAQTGL